MKVGISAGTANSLLGPLLPFFMQCIKNPPQAAACGGVVGVWRFELQALVPNQARYHCAIPRKKTAAHRLPLLVAEEGFEPSQYESESPVLPLHNSAAPSHSSALLLYEREAAPCQPLFSEKIPVPESCRTARQAFPALAIPIAFRYNEKNRHRAYPSALKGTCRTTL